MNTLKFNTVVNSCVNSWYALWWKDIPAAHGDQHYHKTIADQLFFGTLWPLRCILVYAVRDDWGIMAWVLRLSCYRLDTSLIYFPPPWPSVVERGFILTDSNFLSQPSHHWEYRQITCITSQVPRMKLIKLNIAHKSHEFTKFVNKSNF